MTITITIAIWAEARACAVVSRLVMSKRKAMGKDSRSASQLVATGARQSRASRQAAETVNRDASQPAGAGEPASALRVNIDPAVAAAAASEFTVPAAREHMESFFECVFRFRNAGLLGFVETEILGLSNRERTVSYTHLTLPTICSV